MTRLSVFLCVLLVLLVPCTAVAAGGFSQSDFTGTWYFNELIAGDGPAQEPGWSYGSVSYGTDGMVNYMVTNHNDQTDMGTATNTLVLDATGIITDPANPAAGLYGVMSDDKSLWVQVQMEQPKSQPKLSVFLKRAATGFSAADLEGSWHYYGLVTGDAPAQQPGWYRGSLTLNASGTLVSATPVVDSTGVPNCTPGMSFQVDTGGILTVPAAVAYRGVLSDDKKMVAAVSTMCPCSTQGVCGYNLQIWIKQSATVFGQADLAGTWYALLLTAGDAPQFTGEARGPWRIGPDGAAAVTAYSSDGGVYNQSTTLSIDADGVISGMGRLNGGRDVMVFTMADGGGGYNLMLGVKRQMFSPAGDANHDGQIGIDDVVHILQLLTGARPAQSTSVPTTTSTTAQSTTETTVTTVPPTSTTTTPSTSPTTSTANTTMYTTVSPTTVHTTIGGATTSSSTSSTTVSTTVAQ